MKNRSTTRSLDEVIAALPQRERRKVATRARALIAEEMSLRELRKALGRTQVSVARRLGVGQEAVSRLEMREDMYVSTLRGLLKALGGELELVARFPGRAPARLRIPHGSEAGRRQAKAA